MDRRANIVAESRERQFRGARAAADLRGRFVHGDLVARAVAEHKGPRPYVFTKCERTWNENREIKPSLKAESIRRECEASLRRLKVDVIDLYQIHWPQPPEDVEEGWGALAQLQEQGKV